jgi:hypothetical protein
MDWSSKRKWRKSSIKKANHTRETEYVTVAFPRVKEGSVVEISYTMKDPNFLDPEWTFQHSIPSRKSEYTLFLPAKILNSQPQGIF